MAPRTGRLFAGTSGFAYPAWSPRFYPPRVRAAEMLRLYASRLAACELNNTFYQQPRPEKVAAWLAATPSSFRFTAKAQRGGSMRALAGDPTTAVPWLTGPLRAFGARLGAVLYRIPDTFPADLDRLGRLLVEWPADLPLVIEARHPSWRADGITRLLTDARAVLCATDLPDEAAPTLRLTGRFLYLRLRRNDYDAQAVAVWADRVVPFLAAGHDVFAFFRHDEVGHAPELAQQLAGEVAARLEPVAVGRTAEVER